VNISTPRVIASVAKQSIFVAKCNEEDGLLRCARNDGVGRSDVRFNAARAEVRKKFFFEKKNQKTFVRFPQQEFHQGSLA
jgi:hypothetical protein